jgi:hypothetical protein
MYSRKNARTQVLSSMPRGSAWASGEHILPNDQARRNSKENGILVAQEITVREERTTATTANGKLNTGAYNTWDDPDVLGSSVPKG